ncbi:Intermediate filament protein ifa-2,Muscle cell intermediate filament protein AV71,Intermediate filament protein ifa-1,Muscle cell intermediate filament protein OV71,Intermediate filament protein B,70 kDa neurofilament protein,60 kDa neurofilament protein,Intermediate filament protein A [Mytilus coruscus]|uniref:IF rod domain-containing protein n=1 Tax=Mytilus coruscus TaxID=42192 RepID=A0A6J8CHK0_MYTCO|nr:Intermediate filament protein ifa-2,Muscle cell intermediate filament protein AV71,Intermediate filament protein ifa-1,Muscle cell intermediate filament protein OV71,Intermediate filament protein B,70 kDa neurofilament protein,60 kDa neurofilament protein,Intermediate filament protein A [Mytilus coruscus]
MSKSSERITEKRTVITSSSSAYDDGDDSIYYKSGIQPRQSTVVSRSSVGGPSMRSSIGGGSGGTVYSRTVEYGIGRSAGMAGLSPGSFEKVSNSGVQTVKSSREKEKKDMQDLNERFANYIEKVRFLEAQNRKLASELENLKTKWGKETSAIKSMYEQELAEARKLIDDLTRDKNKLEIQNSSLQEDMNNLRRQMDDLKKYHAIDQEQINKLNQQLSDYESEINMLRRTISSLETERGRDKERINKLQSEVDRLRIDLNNETLNHLDAENRRQTLEEEMEFLKKVHEQELKELAALAYRDTTEENREFWKSELSQAIRDIQSEYDNKVDQLRGDMESYYNLKVQEFRTGATKQNMEVTHVKEENKKLVKSISDLKGRLADLEGRNAQLESQYNSLLREYESIQSEHTMETVKLKEEITNLRSEMEAILVELQSLMDAKLSLELEIAAYRKLLESEESSDLFNSYCNEKWLFNFLLHLDLKYRVERLRRLGINVSNMRSVFRGSPVNYKPEPSYEYSTGISADDEQTERDITPDDEIPPTNGTTGNDGMRSKLNEPEVEQKSYSDQETVKCITPEDTVEPNEMSKTENPTESTKCTTDGECVRLEDKQDIESKVESVESPLDPKSPQEYEIRKDISVKGTNDDECERLDNKQEKESKVESVQSPLDQQEQEIRTEISGKGIEDDDSTNNQAESKIKQPDQIVNDEIRNDVLPEEKQSVTDDITSEKTDDNKAAVKSTNEDIAAESKPQETKIDSVPSKQSDEVEQETTDNSVTYKTNDIIIEKQNNEVSYDSYNKSTEASSKETVETQNNEKFNGDNDTKVKSDDRTVDVKASPGDFDVDGKVQFDDISQQNQMDDTKQINVDDAIDHESVKHDVGSSKDVSSHDEPVTEASKTIEHDISEQTTDTVDNKQEEKINDRNEIKDQTEQIKDQNEESKSNISNKLQELDTIGQSKDENVVHENDDIKSNQSDIISDKQNQDDSQISKSESQTITDKKSDLKETSDQDDKITVNGEGPLDEDNSQNVNQKNDEMDDDEDSHSSMKMMRGEVSAKTTYQKTSTGPVSIAEVHPEGKYITLENTSAQRREINLDGWKLKRELDGQKEYVYTFKNFILKPNKSVKIFARGFASDAGINDLVFRDYETWGVGSNVQTTLINENREEKATHRQKTNYN